MGPPLREVDEVCDGLFSRNCVFATILLVDQLAETVSQDVIHKCKNGHGQEWGHEGRVLQPAQLFDITQRW